MRPLDSIAQVHAVVWVSLGLRRYATEAGLAYPVQLRHSLDQESPVEAPFFADLPVDDGLRVDAYSIRCPSMVSKQPWKNQSPPACWTILRSGAPDSGLERRCPLPTETHAVNGPTRWNLTSK